MAFDITPFGAIADFAGKIVDKLWPDKAAQEAERNKAQLAILELQQQGAFQELQLQMSAILAEAQSADAWTSRARPSFLYVMYMLMLTAVPMGVLSAFRPEIATQVAAGMQSWLGAIPEPMWWTFGAGYLGYTGMRGIEKMKGGK